MKASRQIKPPLVAVLASFMMTGAAEGYSYDGQRTIVDSKCIRDSDDSYWQVLANGGGYVVHFRGAMPGGTSRKLFDIGFQRTSPSKTARGNGLGLRLNLAGAGDTITATARREVLLADSIKNISIDYPILDELKADGPTQIIQGTTWASLDIRAYISSDIAWIETSAGPSPLARTLVTPLFAGYGPLDSSQVSLHLSVGTPGDAITVCRQLDIFTFNTSSNAAQFTDRLTHDFSQQEPGTPFLEDGERRSAAAMVISLN